MPKGVERGLLRLGMKDCFNKEKKGEFNMAEHEKPQVHFFMGLLIGTFLGALAGIFFAPKSGKELRSDIKEKGSEVLKDGREIYSDASARVKEIVEEVKHQAKELKKEAEGTGERIAGEVQEKIGQVKKVCGSSESGVSCTGMSLCPRLRLHDTPQPGLRKGMRSSE
jgi:gas vesicle protein